MEHLPYEKTTIPVVFVVVDKGNMREVYKTINKI